MSKIKLYRVQSIPQLSLPVQGFWINERSLFLAPAPYLLLIGSQHTRRKNLSKVMDCSPYQWHMVVRQIYNYETAQP